MKKFILTFLAFLFVQVSVMAFEGNIKFVQVTDAHFNRNNSYTVDVLKSAVKEINEIKDLSFVIFTGDNIDKASIEDLEAFLEIVGKLNHKYYLVLGNHDVFKSQGLSKEKYNEIVRSHNYTWHYRKWNYTFKKNGYTFIVLDGSKEVIPGPGGYFRKETLEWFDKQLKKNKDRPVIVFQHYPVFYRDQLGAGRLKSHKVYKVEDYYEVLNKYDNIQAVITGHFHVNCETMDNGVYHINTPTLLTNPPSYKVIEIVTKKGLSPIIYTQLKNIENVNNY